MDFSTREEAMEVAVYDVLTEDDQLWRRHANQMRRAASMDRHHDSTQSIPDEGRRNNGMDAAEHQATSSTPPTSTRPSRHRRPPERLQVDPCYKMYRCSS